MKPQRAAVYVRISDDRAKDAAGIARQEQDARALADRLGWSVAEVIPENDTSAYKRRRVELPNGRHELRVVRPGFRRVLDMIVSGETDGLIAYDLDRTARDPRDLEDLIDAVEQRTPRLPVESVTGSLRLANDSDVTMARVMVAVANKSSRDSSRRIKRKHEELAQLGKYAGGGARRFGYESDGVALREDEAKELRWAVDGVLAGRTVSSIARELDERGVRPVKAQRWSSKSLTDILRSPRIAGLRVHRGEVVGPADWPAIIDQDTHDELVATLSQRSKGAVQPALTRWCNGLLICSRCDALMVGAYQTPPKPHRYWCNPQRGGCGGTAINGPGTEDEIERQVLEYLTRPDVLSALSAGSQSDDSAAARTALAEDEQQLRDLAKMWAEKAITLAEYTEARRIIESRINQARQASVGRVPQHVRALLQVDDIAASWDALAPPAKREVVRAVLAVGGFRGWLVHPADLTGPRLFQPGRLELTAK